MSPRPVDSDPEREEGHRKPEARAVVPLVSAAVGEQGEDGTGKGGSPPDSPSPSGRRDPSMMHGDTGNRDRHDNAGAAADENSGESEGKAMMKPRTSKHVSVASSLSSSSGSKRRRDGPSSSSWGVTSPTKAKDGGSATTRLKPAPRDKMKRKDGGAGVAESSVDSTTVEGQLALDPDMGEDEAREAAKREYNRRNAHRARVRNKEM